MLEPVRESYRTGQPLRWTRVHNLAEFAYFNHSIHVNKGVGCATCHGRGRSDAAGLTGKIVADGMVPGLSSQSRAVPPAA